MDRHELDWLGAAVSIDLQLCARACQFVRLDWRRANGRKIIPSAVAATNALVVLSLDANAIVVVVVVVVVANA